MKKIYVLILPILLSGTAFGTVICKPTSPNAGFNSLSFADATFENLPSFQGSSFAMYELQEFQTRASTLTQIVSDPPYSIFNRRSASSGLCDRTTAAVFCRGKSGGGVPEINNDVEVKVNVVDLKGYVGQGNAAINIQCVRQ